jgi:lipopolysaccharide export LptBFGC system permease protein LptF
MRIEFALASVFSRSDPLDDLVRKYPKLEMDANLWRMERLALLRREAGLSVEIHKKFALPVACVVFVLIGAPIGMRVRRAGPAVAFASIGFFLFYYVCLIGGEELANRLLLPPWLAMWLANLVLGALGLDLTARACDIRLPWHRRWHAKAGSRYAYTAAEGSR